MSSVSAPSPKRRFISDYYQRTRIAKYLAQFHKDPLRLSNPRLLWDECEWAPMGLNYVLVRKERSPSGRAVPAEVRLVGEISEEKFNLYIDGGWDGRYDTGIEKARASGKLCRGRIPEVGNLWPLFLEALNEIVMARGPTQFGKKFPIVENGVVKFRHKLFQEVSKIQDSVRFTPRAVLESTPSFNLKAEDTSTPTNSPKKKPPMDLPKGTDTQATGPEEDLSASDDFEVVDSPYQIPDPLSVPGMSQGGCPNDVESTSSDTIEDLSDIGDEGGGAVTGSEEDVADETDYSSGDEVGPEFEASNWVCRTPKAQEALRKLIQRNEYIGRPIPVFTLDGDRVLPADYESKLKGALVDLTMTLTNVSYKQWGFYADVVSIVILSPPGYGPVLDTVKNRTKKHMSKPAHLKRFLKTEERVEG